MPIVEQLGQGGNGRQLAEDRFEIVLVVVRRVLLEVERAVIAGELKAAACDGALPVVLLILSCCSSSYPPSGHSHGLRPVLSFPL